MSNHHIVFTVTSVTDSYLQVILHLFLLDVLEIAGCGEGKAAVGEQHILLDLGGRQLGGEGGESVCASTRSGHHLSSR